MTSTAVEDYLKGLYHLEREAPAGNGVATRSLAGWLKVRAASVTKMVQRLAGWGLVDHTPYRGSQLTAKGRREALRVVRRHRLLETFLVESLGLGWSQAHHEAEQLEHGLSPELEGTIAEALGHPERDPHGHPIPDREGRLPESRARPLATLRDGDHAQIEQLDDHDSEVLNWLLLRGLLPGHPLKVLEVDPFDGSLTVELEHQQHRLSRTVAQAVKVLELEGSPAVGMSQAFQHRTLSLSRPPGARSEQHVPE